MISDAPTIATRDLITLRDKLAAFVTIAQMKARDGLTVAEFSELLIAALRMAIAVVDSIPTDGAAKKQMVMDAVAAVFDGLADRMIPTLAYPVWIVARPAVRALVLMFADGAIESMLPLVRGAK